MEKSFNIKGLILSGGPSSVYDKNALQLEKRILTLGLPLLGICYGHQLIAYLSKGKVKPAAKKEFGITSATIDKPVEILDGLSSQERVWMSHGDTVYELPSEYESLAHTESCPISAFRHKKKPIYGLQWHPEVIHTEKGAQILGNFISKICKCNPNWTMENFAETAIKEIKQAVGESKAIIALSGGVDSSTAAALATKALGERLTAIFVDHGFMRENEAEAIKHAFEKSGINLIIANEAENFQKKLKGVINPERKRKIIGEEFIKVFERIAKNIGAEYLIQGTIYPDRIESGFRRHSDTIKTHHNVGGMPLKTEFKGVVEPLRDLYKDEVRQVAETLGLPKTVTCRQPFPGPGLAVRVIGEVTPEKIDLVRKADKIVTDEIEKSGLDNGLWQYFAVLTNIRTTGVKGDARAYGYAIAVRVVESSEAMTANFAKLPYEILEKISTRITNEIPEVTRVVYDITHKPPSTIEWE